MIVTTLAVATVVTLIGLVYASLSREDEPSVSASTRLPTRRH